MRLVLQRVKSARVLAGGEEVSAIGKGILALVAVEEGDDGRQAETAAEKVVHLRIFDDDAGKMNLDVRQVGGAVLIVSQFTLAARLAKGRRPSFDRAARPEVAEPLVKLLASEVARHGVEAREGRFRSHMEVELRNDGPVTFVLDV